MHIKHIKKYLPLIQAFAEGKTVQYRSFHSKGEWKDFKEHLNFECLSFEYRIKPNSKKGWYRVAVFKGGNTNTLNHRCGHTEKEIEMWSNFSHWLTDRVEFEYEEEQS